MTDPISRRCPAWRAASAAALLFGFSLPLSIAGANVALGGFLLSMIAARAPLRPARTPLDAPLLAFLAAWLASSLAGLDPARSLAGLAPQLRFLLFYLLAWAAGGAFTGAALRGYLWGAGGAVLFGFMQWGVTAAGWAVPLAEASGLPVRYFALHDGRMHGAVNALTYAEVLIPAFSLSLAAWLEAADRKRLLLSGLAVAVTGIVLLINKSRGPLTGVAALILALAWLHPRRARLLWPVLLLGGALLLFPSLHRRVTAPEPGGLDQSSGHRLILWNNAWEVVKRRPVLGVGPRNLEMAVKRYRHEGGFLPNPRGMDGDAHNQYLHFLAERGVPGLAAFLWLLYTILIYARGIWREKGGVVPLGILAAWVGFTVFNLTERAFDDAEVALTFWILTASLGSSRAPVPPPVENR